MEKALQWGLDCIRAIQSFASPPLTMAMKGITGLGTAAAYLIIISVIYWCMDEKKGIRLALVFLISAWINISLKFLLDQPRPFFDGYDPSLGIIGEKLGGLPSGHAQNSMVTFVVIASWWKKKKLYAIAAALCLLISFSRIYLGVHFPTDILGGWLLGALVLFGYFKLGPVLEKFLERGGTRAGMIAGAALAYIMILYRPGGEALIPGGIMLGISAGFCLNRRYIGFKSSAFFSNSAAENSRIKYLILTLRFLAGIASLLLIYAALEKLLPENPQSGNNELFIFFKYAVAALWGSAGVPWLFKLIRLSGAPPQEVEEK
ncbi:MAG: phosphatase PAP2 family protein [Treponema sp.]|nr:phosphatase PAP2 family protein [Treponema sp.]